MWHWADREPEKTSAFGKKGRLSYLVVGLFVLVVLAVATVLSGRAGKLSNLPSKRQARSYTNRALVHRISPATSIPVPQHHPSIRGVVYDTTGVSVAGATITAATYDVAGNVPTIVGSTQSNDRGRFEIPLQAGTYHLTAVKGGYGPTATDGRSGENISLILPKSAVIEGHVYDDAGNPARVFAMDLLSFVPGDVPTPPPVWSRRFQTTDGSYRIDQLPDWSVVVRATADGFAPAFSASVVVARGRSKTVDLQLSRGCVLTGKTVDQTGTPLPYVFVDAEAEVGAGSMGDASYDADHQTESDAEGGFRFEHVPIGALIVRGYDGANAVTTVRTRVPDCAHAQPVTLVMSKGGRVEGIARGSDGAPLAFARVTVSERSVGFITTLTDEKGFFGLDDLPPTLVRLQLDHEGRSTHQFVLVKSGVSVQKDLVLFGVGEGEIRGRVTAADIPLGGVRVMLASSHGRVGGLDMFFPTTDDDGTFRLSSVPVGTYLTSVVSSAEGKGIQVKARETTMVDLDIASTLRAEPGTGTRRLRRGENAPQE